MRLTSLAIFSLFALSLRASTIDYSFTLQTSEGYDVKNIVMYATNGAGSDNIYFNPVTVPASGLFHLQHTVSFVPTSAMIVGVMQRNQDQNMDLVMWVNDQFASSALGLRYSEVFPSGTAPGHNLWPGVIDGAKSGDSVALGLLYSFFRNDHAINPLFDPSGAYSIIEFSIVTPPIGGSVPEPSTLALFGAGAVALILRAKLRS